MNSWKFNSKSNYYLRKLIIDTFKILPSEVYKQIKNIDESNLIFKDKDGFKYQLTLKKI